MEMGAQVTDPPIDWDSPRPTQAQLDAALSAILERLSPEDQAKCKTDVALSYGSRAKKRTLEGWYAVAWREYVEGETW